MQYSAGHLPSDFADRKYGCHPNLICVFKRNPPSMASTPAFFSCYRPGKKEKEKEKEKKKKEERRKEKKRRKLCSK